MSSTVCEKERLVLYKSTSLIKSVFGIEDVAVIFSEWEKYDCLTDVTDKYAICRFRGNFVLEEEKIVRCSTQIKVSSTEESEFQIVGMTSLKGWISESYVNNLLFDGVCHCFEGILKVLSFDEKDGKKVFRVQFLIIGEGILND